MNKTILQIAAIAAFALGMVAANAADLVIVGNPAAAALTKDQAADLYLGRTTSSNPVDLPEASPLRTEFYKKLTGKDPAQVKALWSRLTFSGKGQPPKEMSDAAAVKKAVAADPKAVGYIEKSAVDGSVKVIATVD
jgi:ABC-type phosphate transport system substrate-binding protein